MKLSLLKTLILSVLITTLSTETFKSHGKTHDDPTKPLTQINKTFKIIVHIVLNQDSNPGITENTIRQAVNGVNDFFAPIAANFDIAEFRYIENHNYNGSQENPLTLTLPQEELAQIYNIDRRINMYFIKANPDSSLCGRATRGGISSIDNPSILMLKDCVDSRVLAHLFGLYFGLHRTFEGNELVDGSNCETDGDLVCDTPADPYTGEDMDDYIDPDNCQFIYKGKDENGDYYDPDVSNIMSFYNCPCPRFSHGQYERMANFYLSNPMAW
ncbi:hypothetical protein RCC89_16180 [Cytophagaceae bacterium ABcell3]|nr:hypothetical protein RCC89_16180 [Cytophagaceae bacterium ABcell3]